MLAKFEFQSNPPHPMHQWYANYREVHGEHLSFDVKLCQKFDMKGSERMKHILGIQIAKIGGINLFTYLKVIISHNCLSAPPKKHWKEIKVLMQYLSKIRDQRLVS